MGVSVWRLQIGLMLLKEGVKRALQGLVTGALLGFFHGELQDAPQEVL